MIILVSDRTAFYSELVCDIEKDTIKFGGYFDRYRSSFKITYEFYCFVLHFLSAWFERKKDDYLQALTHVRYNKEKVKPKYILSWNRIQTGTTIKY